jgi:hypothetical protein
MTEIGICETSIGVDSAGTPKNGDEVRRTNQCTVVEYLKGIAGEENVGNRKY